MSKASFPYLKQADNAVILNITATLGNPATKYQIHSATAKVGVDSLTRSLALEWGRYGIRVVGLAPGATEDSEGLRRLASEESLKRAKTVVPLGRLGNKEELGYLACFLVSPVAGYITGDTIVCDGGAVLYRPPQVTEEQLNAINAMLKKTPQGKL
eukprot:TRINITY_DN467_c0_g1_i1.p1 TRINITY_DN467_c0_g1~~TRINITY_DN467_c0_g1_i1.p1  ORF type:complete len:156 (-),score=40.99 TRINITY_DN467_c0_g1_i1:66-533(-)